jgi:hypothetical protein
LLKELLKLLEIHTPTEPKFKNFYKNNVWLSGFGSTQKGMPEIVLIPELEREDGSSS